MTERINAATVAPSAYRAVFGLELAVREFGLSPKLLHLVKLRASQINGCAFCIDMHAKEALDDGEDPQHLHLLTAWRESPLYTPTERAALSWTETVTRLADGAPSDADYQSALEALGEDHLVKLTVAIGTINVWNRLAASFRTPHPIGMDARVGG